MNLKREIDGDKHVKGGRKTWSEEGKEDKLNWDTMAREEMEEERGERYIRSMKRERERNRVKDQENRNGKRRGTHGKGNMKGNEGGNKVMGQSTNGNDCILMTKVENEEREERERIFDKGKVGTFCGIIEGRRLQGKEMERERGGREKIGISGCVT